MMQNDEHLAPGDVVAGLEPYQVEAVYRYLLYRESGSCWLTTRGQAKPS